MRLHAIKSTSRSSFQLQAPAPDVIAAADTFGRGRLWLRHHMLGEISIRTDSLACERYESSADVMCQYESMGFDVVGEGDCGEVVVDGRS